MQELFGPYQLIERIAAGGMAEIFKARTLGQYGFEKTLAIKRLHPRYTQHPEFVEMLKQEAKIAVGLSHPNIVQIFDLGRVQEHFFIAMEYIHGRDLNQTFNRLNTRRERWPLEAALYVLSQVCAGLDHAHRQRGPDGQLLRLIHRDVTPQNVMVSTEGDVKLVDFGIAKVLNSTHETEAGIIKGKFCFMSPEQAHGARLDHRTDIFSAGIVLYELLAGRPLYDDSDDQRLLTRVRSARFQPLSELRPDLPGALFR
ncbi:MAG: serine/threonine protein kinase, partial [Deltaproteobacteria bacterium]|nr:serine/threonine protein kinase [Deltaproteobacteria bacterium]